MASKKHPPAGQLTRAAVAAGQKLAKAALATRAEQRKGRTRAAPAGVRRGRRRPTAKAGLTAAPAAPAVPAKALALLGPGASTGVLIAEGDSWFDYPGDDVLRLLEDEHLFEVESVARAGDRIEEMAHSEGQFQKFTRTLEKVLRNGKVPRAILLSGGGNDIAGDDFAVLVNHARSALPAINEDVLRGVIDVRLRAAYAAVIAGVTTIAKSFLGRPIPIVTHGYAYAVPDGRGYLGGFWFLPGPWLEPGFRKKGHEQLANNQRVVAQMIDRFNAMLQSLSAHPGFEHVHHLDLRKALRHDGSYKQHWANELHPTELGFELVTQRFAELIATL